MGEIVVNSMKQRWQPTTTSQPKDGKLPRGHQHEWSTHENSNNNSPTINSNHHHHQQRRQQHRSLPPRTTRNNIIRQTTPPQTDFLSISILALLPHICQDTSADVGGVGSIYLFRTFHGARTLVDEATRRRVDSGRRMVNGGRWRFAGSHDALSPTLHYTALIWGGVGCSLMAGL